MDADTIFPSGSTGKAFTVAALGILVDQGKIAWDDKVIDHLPGFQMYDPWVTREMTIRDLLVHRSGLGLGAGDLLFVPRTNLTRAESVRRLRYIKPATSFRSGFAYDNVLYMVAGQLIESVTGQTWEQFMAEQVLRPAGMLHATADAEAHFAAMRTGRSHTRAWTAASAASGTQELLDERDELGRTAAPAGGLAISANDFARWLSIQLHAGSCPGMPAGCSRPPRTQQMWTPVVLQPIEPRPDALKLTQPNFYTYALGWDVMDYRGTKVVWHSGAVFGFLTAVMLIPERHVGFSIQINSEDGQIIRGLMYELLDHYLGLPRTDWVERYQAEKQRRVGEALTALKAPTAQPAAGRPLAPPGALHRHLRRPLVRQHRSHPGGRQACDRLQVDPAHVRHARALAVRHLRHAPCGQEHRACLRDLWPRRRWGHRTGDHEGSLAAGGLQLRLPGPAVRAGGEGALNNRDLAE